MLLLVDRASRERLLEMPHRARGALLGPEYLPLLFGRGLQGFPDLPAGARRVTVQLPYLVAAAAARRSRAQPWQPLGGMAPLSGVGAVVQVGGQLALEAQQLLAVLARLRFVRLDRALGASACSSAARRSRSGAVRSACSVSIRVALLALALGQSSAPDPGRGAQPLADEAPLRRVHRP